MTKLDTRGEIGAAQIGFYGPVLALTGILIFRYALRRDAGWLFLFLFSLNRIGGGALIVAAETIHSKIALYNAAYIMDYAGLVLLLFSALGFIGMAGQHTYSENSRVIALLRVVGTFGLVGLSLSVSGGVFGTQPNSHQSIGTILRRAGVCIYAGMYVVIFAVHLGAWTYRWYLRSYRRNLLWGLFAALPFLGVRVAYAVLASWSSSDLYGVHISSNSTLAKFNPITGNWILYLILSPAVEYIVVLLYLFASIILANRHHHH